MNQKYVYKYDKYNRNGFKKRNFKYKKDINSLSNIPQKYKDLLKDKEWPHPSVLSNSIILSNGLDKFFFTEKIDGLHVHLLIFDKKIYNCSKTKQIEQIDNSKFKNMNFNGDCIIETEFYNNFYFIFDVYYLNGVDYSEKYISERIESIKQYLNDLGSSFKIKNYQKIPDLNYLLEYIKNEKSPEGNDIDGVILQRIDMPYFQKSWKEFTSYKLKPIFLNTIDFLLKYNRRINTFALYLKGNYNSDYLNNYKKLPKDNYIYRINNIDKPLDGKKRYLFQENEKVLIYFDSPFYPNLGQMKIQKNWNKNNYSLRAIKLIDDLIEKIERDPSSYNNSIIELSLTEDKKWVPLKIREDKTLPNSYKVGLNNISVIFDPIKPLDSIYFQKNISNNKYDEETIHKINQTFRKYLIECYINQYRKHLSIIDLCGGRGADQFNLYINGVSNFFVVDSDTTALKRYFDRTGTISQKIYEPLFQNYRHRNMWGRDYISLNFLNYKLDKDYEEIKKDLFSRYEFEFKKFKNVDIALMNFAIHYLCDEKEKLEKLCEFVDSILNKNGFFIITYFDGDKILKMKNNNNNIANIGPYNIEIIKEEKDYTIAKMPLPTFKSGNNIYIEEPLVHGHMIKILENYFDLYEEYYIYDKCKKFVDKIENVQKYIDYYKLIKAAIYYKKNK